MTKYTTKPRLITQQQRDEIVAISRIRKGATRYRLYNNLYISSLYGLSLDYTKRVIWHGRTK